MLKFGRLTPDSPSMIGSDSRFVLNVGALEFSSAVTIASLSKRSVIAAICPFVEDEFIRGGGCGEEPLKVTDWMFKLMLSKLPSSIDKSMSIGAAGPDPGRGAGSSVEDLNYEYSD